VDDTVRNFGVPTVSVRDQLQLDPRRITVGAAVELCEPATKELFALRPLRSCGLLGPEALLALVPLAQLWRRRGAGSA
jgi:hypothetical protein